MEPPLPGGEGTLSDDPFIVRRSLAALAVAILLLHLGLVEVHRSHDLTSSVCRVALLSITGILSK
jgi:hypothetical protein